MQPAPGSTRLEPTIYCERMPDQDSDSPEAGPEDRVLTSEELEDLTSAEPSPTPVTFATQDFDVAGLVLRLQRESMLVPSFGGTDTRVDTDGFQRGFVWNKAQMDRFIESLLLGYPIPGIFLVKQSSNNRMLVLDGQQRLITLRRFYEGIHEKREFSLQNVGSQFRGLTYKSLDDSLRFKLDDSYLQATIVATDGSAEVNDAIYQIFERLNAGGTQLTAHEIRVALSAGPLIAYLEELNNLESWRELYGRKNSRLRDQELILRILALYLNSDEYARPLKTFLNTFASTHRGMDDAVRSAGLVFAQAVDALTVVGPAALRRPGGTQVNVAQAEAIVVGTMRAVARGQLRESIKDGITDLLEDPEFVIATTRSTADKEFVTQRLDRSTAALTQK